LDFNSFWGGKWLNRTKGVQLRGGAKLPNPVEAKEGGEEPLAALVGEGEELSTITLSGEP